MSNLAMSDCIIIIIIIITTIISSFIVEVVIRNFHIHITIIVHYCCNIQT